MESGSTAGGHRPSAPGSADSGLPGDAASAEDLLAILERYHHGAGGGRRGAAPNKAGSFLGVKVGGPTRVGHYFLPTFTVNEQVRGLPDKGPVMEPGKAYEWSLVYNPAGNDGKGAITATLGNESVTHNLKRGHRAKAKEALLDHFGMFSIGPGGQIVKLYLDDLQYTASPTGSRGPETHSAPSTAPPPAAAEWHNDK
jgi:hypothetical protein